MKTLTWQRLAQEAPDVSIITEFPGLVVTNLFNKMRGWNGFLMRTFVLLFGWLLAVPLDESAERHVFMATSASFSPAQGDAKGVPLVEGLETQLGVDGQPGSGVYSVTWDNDASGEKVVALLKRYNEDGTGNKVWEWMQGEYVRILGTSL
jgi:hypothetical protein